MGLRISSGKIRLLIAIGILVVTTPVPAAAQVPGGARSAKGCAICHFRWIETFFIQGKGTDLVDYQAGKVVATPDMCISCHDGSVMDSRARMVEGKGHKTGVGPPQSMDIPGLYPLDDAGRVQCATCHTAHGVPSDEDGETTIFMRSSNRNSAMCRQCHPGREQTDGSGNHPMGTLEQKIPDELLRRSHAKPRRATQMICETCHTAHGSPYDAYLIESYRNSDLCLTCHPQKSVTTREGWRKPGHVVNVEPKTAVIPASLMEKGARTGPQGEVICSTCHDVHGSNPSPDLLVAAYDGGSSLCLTCHADKAVVAGTRHNLDKSAPGVSNLQGQTVAQAGVCSACHLPHKPARDLTGEGDYTSRLCMSCHGPGKFSARPRVAGPSHPVRVTPYQASPAGLPYSTAAVDPETFSLPLYDTYGVRSERGQMTCTTCHDPHQHTPGSTAENSSDVKNLFLRVTNPDLCRQCHADKFAVAASKHNLRQTAPGSVNRLNQTPAQAGLCANCHLTHGGLATFLWARTLPESAATTPPAPCFSCHREEGLAAGHRLSGNNHPVHVAAALPSSISRMPLFDARGRPAEEGQIACYTCHDPHRWAPNRTVSAADALSQEGDAATSFLRLQNTPQPELCTRCHPEAATVSATEHNLLSSAPQTRNALGQSPQMSGPCGSCHLPHHSENRALLWARQLPHAGNVVEGMCRSCHTRNAPAENKIPAIASHPQDMVFSNTDRHRQGQPDFFPLYDPATAKPVLNGTMTCASCHDTHRWSPMSQRADNQSDNEGNASSSFLRNLSFNTICIDCHGPEALYRYLNFHDPEKRRSASEATPARGLRYSAPYGGG